jgi:hypothetical protein
VVSRDIQRRGGLVKTRLAFPDDVIYNDPNPRRHYEADA